MSANHRCIQFTIFAGVVAATVFAAKSAPATELLTLEEGALVMQLTEYEHLFGPDYSEKWSRDGVLVEAPATARADRSTCRYYTGEGGGRIGAFSRCEGVWRGLVLDESTVSTLRPDGTLEDVTSTGECGLDHAVQGPVHPVDLLPDPRTLASHSRTRYVELGVVTDPLFEELAAEADGEADPALIVLAAALYYQRSSFQPAVLPVLSQLVRFVDESPWVEPERPTEAWSYLNAFDSWYREQDALMAADSTLILTGSVFDDALGVANLGSACTRVGTGLVTAGRIDSSRTFAHEVGHLIGMVHDGQENSCSTSGFVMAPAANLSAGATEFSSCSLEEARAFLHLAGGCVDSSPRQSFEGPNCGDGLLERGEQCDCGPLGCGDNPCCDESTCQLVDGARCAGDDGCCDLATCEPVAAGVVCREARSDCDAEEFCTGGGLCPDDQIAPTGRSCNFDEGSCYLGSCIERGTTCGLLAATTDLADPPYDPLCDFYNGECSRTDCAGPLQCSPFDVPLVDGSPCGRHDDQCYEGECREPERMPSPLCLRLTDHDGDGIDSCGDNADQCPLDPAKVEPGECGCLRPETEGCLEPGQPDAGAEDVVVTLPEEESGGCGCASSGGEPPFELLFILGLLGLGRVGRWRGRQELA